MCSTSDILKPQHCDYYYAHAFRGPNSVCEACNLWSTSETSTWVHNKSQHLRSREHTKRGGTR